MQIGFIRSLLFERYGELWVQLVSELGLEPVWAEQDATRAALQSAKLTDIPGVSFQVAAAEALALTNCDYLIAPDLNPGAEVPRGGGEDPWITSFPEMLGRSLSGLPTLLSVPVTSNVDVLEARATELLLSLSRDPARSRRAWERHAHLTQGPRRPAPRFQRIPGETKTLALVGQAWLFKEGIISALRERELGSVHLVLQKELEPATLREEAWRTETRLVPTDAETLGAARYFARRGQVDKLLFLGDKRSGADAWLLAQVKKISHKPVRSIYLQDLITPDTFDILLS